MSVSEGMDVERVRASERAVLGQVRAVEVARVEARRSAARLAQAWEGQDSSDFQRRWGSAERHLVLVEDGMRRLVEELRAQAQDQERVSEDRGGGSPGGLGLAGHVGATPGEDQSGNPDIPEGEGHENISYRTVAGPVVVDGVEMSDAKQGYLGDCWFVASMMSLARTNPEIIESAIVDNGDGTYDVTLYDDGKPVVVTVSNELPTVAEGDPAYADNDSSTRELWPMLLEKAAAQHLGGDYEDIVGDKPERGLELLTGKEADVYEDGFGFWDDLDQPPAAELYERFQAGDSMVFSTHGEDKSIGDHKLIGAHAYVITDVSPEGDVTLQNPWGVSEHPPITVPYEDFERYSRRLTIIDA